MLKQILSNPTFISILNGQLRHLATLGGGALATRGVIDGAGVEAFAGAAVTIVSMILSALAKRA